MPLTLNPPPTPVEAVTEMLHGVPVTDPYRWLEDQKSPRTRKWLEEQIAYTRTYLDALPGRDRIGKRVEKLLAVEVVGEPWKVGNRNFYLKRKSHSEQPVIMMREVGSDEEFLLVDPVDRDSTATNAVRILAVSKGAELLAYGISHGGDPFHVTEFLDVNSGQILADRLPLGLACGLVFSSDLTGFYYSHEIARSNRPHYRAVYWHKFGSGPERDLEIFFGGEDVELHVELFGSTDGRFLGYRVARASDPQAYAVYVQDIASGKPPRKILEETGSIFVPCFIGSRLLALTDWDAPNLRIVAFDVNDLVYENWLEIVPESHHRVSDFCVVDHLVCVARVENISSQVEVFDWSGRQENLVPCPPNGTVHLIRRPIESDTLFYKFSSFTQPPTIFSWHPASSEQNKWAEAQVPFDSSSILVEQTRYKSKDGTEIPISLVMKKGTQSSCPRPVFLTGYGGFGSSRTPQFNAYSAFLIENGFLFAVANLRGGGEFGTDWHRAAQRHKRQNAIDDFISAAEWLVAMGLTTPGKLAIGGVSNGGLLVGAALTQRPDLFRVVVCVGPILDMLRYHLFDTAHYSINEFGHADNEEDFRHLLAYSPYHRIRNNVSYPSVLIVSGDLDRACNPMHARKMAARLQAANNSGHAILLDYRKTWGHVPVQPLTGRIEALTDRLAFICHELGVDK